VVQFVALVVWVVRELWEESVRRRVCSKLIPIPGADHINTAMTPAMDVDG
jgi:hypothetical protein